MKDTELFERAAEACTMFRVLGAIVERKLSTQFPQVMVAAHWPEFVGLFTVAGCLSVALRLHFEVELSLRTPLEERVQSGLEACFPGSLAIYANGFQYISDVTQRAPRDTRAYIVFPSLAMWLMDSLTDESPLSGADSLVMFLAQCLQDETSNYWSRTA